jgi:hypothetical protein
MKLLANLFAGRVALWRTFWLVGLPIFVLWDLSVGCEFTGGPFCKVPLLGPWNELFTVKRRRTSANGALL